MLETQHSEINKYVEKKLTIKELEEILFNLGFDLDNIYSGRQRQPALHWHLLRISAP